MNKAKIMLTIVAVFGIAGGALAYKASKFYGQVIWTTAVNCQLGAAVNAVVTDLAHRTSNTRVYVTLTGTAPACTYTYIVPSL